MKNLKKEELEKYKKALFIIDMNNGFVNFGEMANNEYNKLVPEQLKILKKFRKEGELINFILESHDYNALEFDTYPRHCLKSTKEAELIPEFINEQNKENTLTFYKNSINGMLNTDVQTTIKNLKNVKEMILMGVCADLCVMDFGRTLSRYLDEINKRTHLFVIKDAIDTFDSPNHNREEWLDISLKVMNQAGIEIIDNINHLEKREKELGLCKIRRR